MHISMHVWYVDMYMCIHENMFAYIDVYVEICKDVYRYT